ncbi:creatininase family protein [Sphingomonas colocasiae]|uniref:Creatininase family protein n=1 Tax=Sphingomonas colocasiae TaxID=1848973 RepID=A0ABS7PUV0_9SPHN|nr:creatininase family protein [Sphingomonas colocasiae]MBY8825127.1 creatininase family protein [Sphingomonas colocasiae]
MQTIIRRNPYRTKPHQGRSARKATPAGSAHLLAVAALLASQAVSGAAFAAGRGPGVFLEDMTTNEVRAKLDAGCPVGIIFSAGGEQTGPHVVLGKHIFRARAYGEAIARNLGDAIVAPVQPFAPNSSPRGDPHAAFAGSIGISTQTFIALNEEIARSLVDGGFRRVALLGDHGNGQKELRTLAAKLDGEYAGRGVRVFFVGGGYDRARRQIEAESMAAGIPAGGHGGLWDTAETLAAKPGSVRMKLLRAGDVSNGGNGRMNEEGFSGDPRRTTVALGKRYAAIRVRHATDELRTYLKDAGPCR